MNLEKFQNGLSGWKEQKISLMSSFPRFWKNIEKLKLPEEELMKFIDIFEEGEEILKNVRKKIAIFAVE